MQSTRFIEDQTLDGVPTDFDEAMQQLVESPKTKVENTDFEDAGFASPLLEKISYVTAVIVQNDRAGRLHSEGMSPDFVEMFKLKGTLFKLGDLPPRSKEVYNEIARRQTKLHPAVETKTDFFG